MGTIDGHRVVKAEWSRGLGRDRRARRIVGVVSLVSAVAGTVAGCVVAPGYVAPGPVYYAPVPVVVAPAPVIVYGRWGRGRW